VFATAKVSHTKSACVSITLAALLRGCVIPGGRLVVLVVLVVDKGQESFNCPVGLLVGLVKPAEKILPSPLSRNSPSPRASVAASLHKGGLVQEREGRVL
jgi:hypothetical protein